jgi:hypothetical protein
MIIVICAWCGEQIGVKGNPGHDGLSISHGICEHCAASVRSEMDAELEHERRAA